MNNSLILYVPKSKNDIEEIKQKYIHWVKSSNTVSNKFKQEIDEGDVCVTRVWKAYHSIDCNKVIVSANASEFSSTTYHVDAKFTGNKIYSDGKYDYYRKEDFKPAHDETNWDISTHYRNITLSKEEGDRCNLYCGEYPNGPTEYACDKFEISHLDEISKYVDAKSVVEIRDIINNFDFRKDCVGCITEEVEKKYKALYSGAFKFTISVLSIHDIEGINSQNTILFPAYEIKVIHNKKKYGGIVYSLRSAQFNAPQYAPQANDKSYKNYKKSIALTSITLIIVILAMILSSTLKHKGLMQMYWLPMIFMALFEIIIIVLLVKQTNKKIYDYESAQLERHRLSIKWLISTIIFSIIICSLTAFLYSKTNDETFFYTPEIVGRYEDDSDDYSKYKINVESCSKDGELVVKHTFKSSKTRYAVLYSGKIVKRTLSKVIVELTIIEYEKLPLNYDADDIIKIEFDANFNSIKYDFITLTRVD